MSRRSSEKKSESHGCCHCWRCLPVPSARSQKYRGLEVLEFGSTVNRRPRNHLTCGEDAPAGYRRYVERESEEIRLRVYLPAAMVMSILLLTLFSMVAIMATADVSQGEGKQVEELIDQIASGAFRDSVAGVGGVVVTVVVALAALSWVDVKQPDDRAYMHMWIDDIKNSGGREQVVSILMSFLSFSFGSLVFAFWVSVLAEGHSKRGSVGGDALIGAILLVVSVVIWVLPSMMRSSKNAIIRRYIILLSDANNYVRGAIANSSIVLSEDPEKLRVWVCAYFVKAFVVFAVPAGVVWGCVSGALGGGVGMGVFVGLTSCCVVGYATQMVADCVRRVPLIRLEFTVGLIALFLFQALFVGGVTVYFKTKQGWNYLDEVEVVAAILVACFWCWVPVIFYVFLGIDIPVLRKMSAYRFAKRKKELVERYNSNFFNKIDIDEIKFDIFDTVVPQGAILLHAKPEEDRRWMKTWSRRAVMMVPEEGKPHRPGPHDVDLRAYIAETLGIVLPGTGTPALPSRVRSSNSAIDEWHIDSSY